MPNNLDNEEWTDLPAEDNEWTDIPENEWKDIEPAAPIADDNLPRKLTDEEISSKFKLYDEVRDAPQNFSDLGASIRQGVGLSGLMEKGAAAAKAGADQLRGSEKTFGEDYDKWIGTQDKEHKDRAERSPHINKGGNMLGAVTTPNIGKTALGRILGNTGLSAADAAARENTVKEALAKAKEAGTTTGILQTIIEAIGPAGKAIKSFANRRAVKSLEPILSQQELLDNKGMKDKLGAELLEQNVTQFGSNVKNQAPRVANLLEDKGEAIRAIRDRADDAGAKIDFSELLSKGDEMTNAAKFSNTGEQSAVKTYLKNAQSMAGNPSRSISDTQKEILKLDKHIPYDKAVFASGGVLTPKQQAFKDLRGDLVGQVDTKIGKFAPEDLRRYLDLKKQYGMFKDADKILDKSVSRMDRNADFGLRDLLMANAATKGSGIEGGLTQMAAAGATKLARERGNSMLAVTADTLSKMLGENPAGLGKYAKPLMEAARRGNNALMATHALMSKDPEYQELLNQQQEGSVP